LESEGIEVFLKDENTVQAYNFLSNAVGGVKLQVRESDVFEAIQIMKESGFEFEEEVPEIKNQEKSFKEKRRFAFFYRIPFIWRFLILAGGITTIIVVSYYFITKPTLEEMIVGHWCLDKMIYDGKEVTPYSTGIQIIFGDCENRFEIQENGRLTLPPIGTNTVNAVWKINDKNIEITSADTLTELYLGIYTVTADEDNIILDSGKLKIFASKWHLNLPYGI
jgi:hypothetical protein